MTQWSVACQAPLSMGILQARILEWVAMPSSRGSSQPRDQTCVFCNAGDLGSIPGLGRTPGRGHGNPLQCSCLENPHGQRSLEDDSPWGRKELIQLSVCKNQNQKKRKERRKRGRVKMRKKKGRNQNSSGICESEERNRLPTPVFFSGDYSFTSQLPWWLRW